MDNRAELEKTIQECFEKMTAEKKMAFLEQLEKLENDTEEKEVPSNPYPYTVRDRLLDDVERFGDGDVENFELVTFLVSISFVVMEITGALLKKSKDKQEIKIEDYKQVLSFKDGLVEKVLSEVALYLVNLLDQELDLDPAGNKHWCYPSRLADMFNIYKVALNQGGDFLIDNAINND